ncbi:MAG: uncultured phage MedDCM-OCT-S37-C6 [Cyanobacteriota bacterium]|jgi:hypothetical protein
MADCNNLAQQIAEIEAKLQQLDEMETTAKAILEVDGLPPAGKSVARLRTYTGDDVGVSNEAWIKQGEADLIAKGTKSVRDLVEMGFRNNEGPRGSSGRMINYRQYGVDYSELSPDDENINALLEVKGLKRANTRKGIELKRPFSESVAMQGLMRMARETGGDVRELATMLGRRFKGIDTLPGAVVQVAKARWDSVSQYADKLEEVAGAMEAGALTDELRLQLGNSAQWAHFFENLDAAVRRRIGQSLRGLQFNLDGANFELISPDADWARLTMADVKGETLLGQTLEHVEKGDFLKLRQLAAVVRTNNLTRTSLNQGRLMSQIALLNNFRRNNMLLSPGTWLARNPVSGALVAFHHGLEDVVEGGLRIGAMDGLRAAGFANRAALDAWQMAWKNASTYLGSGKAVMGLDNAMEVAPDLIRNERQQVVDALTTGFDLLQDPTYWRNTVGAGPAVTLMNVLNAATSLTLGNLGEKFLGWNGGYLPAFRLLGAGDEAIRSLAYAWKVNHEAYLRSFDELGGARANTDAVARRAEEMAEGSLFSGYMSQEDLVKFRRERGIPLGDELPDDVLRLQAFNDLKGVPRADTELGALGLDRAANVTFTNTIKDPIIQGLGLTRQNALVAWQLPFFKTPLNSLLWSIDRTVVPSVVKALGAQMENAAPEVLAQARAQAVVSLGFLTASGAMIAGGGFVGGGPSDPEEYARWRRINTPYSFQLFGKVIPAARFRFGGIDPIDIMGLYADLQQLVYEEGISDGDFQQATTGLATALARMMNNKASLLNTTTVLNAMTQPDRADMADIMATQMGGILPLSGLLSMAARAGRGPLEATDKRRFLTADEKKALEMDPIYAEHVAPVVEFLQKVGEKWARPVPGLNQVLKAPERLDWLGSEIKRPFGIPAEAVIPFMPVIQPQDSLYQWLLDAGVTTKPRPNGQVALPSPGGEGDVGLTMTNEEEKFYRVQMRSINAEIPAAAMLGRETYIPIDGFIQGRDMRSALRALKNSPGYQSLLASDPMGPDQRVNPAKLSARKDSELYRPIQDIIDYYDRAALIQLLTNQDPVAQGFAQRYGAMVKYRSNQLRTRMEELTGLGVGRQ